MKVLIIKMSSLGDVLHTLPALTDAKKHIPNIEFDWVIEPSFSDIPSWHPAVNRVIPFNFRALRKKPFTLFLNSKWKEFKTLIQQKHYDLVIDAQGLLKSAWITLFTKGKRAGLDWHSAWEKPASLLYQQKCSVDPTLHAIDRMRLLFGKALGYTPSLESIDYGITIQHKHAETVQLQQPSLFLFHGTTWKTKLWPECYWIELAQYAIKNEINVYLPWGNKEEQERAQRIAIHHEKITVLPKMNLSEIASTISEASACVSVDTGLGHLAAALSTPCVSLYGPTDPKKTGTRGNNQFQLSANFECAPCLRRTCTYKKPSNVFPACFTTVLPERVWAFLTSHVLRENT